MKVEIFGKNGKKTEKKADLNDAIWKQSLNEDLIAQAIFVYRSNQRVGTANPKTRGEVRGGGRKPWKQKGTGRARSGSTRSPVWVGGGVAFGSSQKNWKRNLNKKMKKRAISAAISQRVTDGKVAIWELDGKMRRDVFADSFGENSKLLVVTDNDNVFKLLRNVEKFDVARGVDLNIMDVVNAHNIVFDVESIDKFEARFVDAK